MVKFFLSILFISRLGGKSSHGSPTRQVYVLAVVNSRRRVLRVLKIKNEASLLNKENKGKQRE